MTKFIELSSIGVSKDSQIRAAKIMGALCDGYQDFKSRNCENFFECAHELMGDRWRRLREVVANSNVFSLPKYPQEYCLFHGEFTESRPGNIILSKSSIMGYSKYLILLQNFGFNRGRANVVNTFVNYLCPIEQHLHG